MILATISASILRLDSPNTDPMETLPVKPSSLLFNVDPLLKVNPPP